MPHPNDKEQDTQGSVLSVRAAHVAQLVCQASCKWLHIYRYHALCITQEANLQYQCCLGLFCTQVGT